MNIDASPTADLMAETAFDSADFGLLYETYADRVYRYMVYHLSQNGDAADLANTVFEKALNAFATFDPAKGSIEAWLFTIARNVCRDHLRRARRWRFVGIEDAKPIVSGEPSPEERLIQSDEIRCLNRALQKLKPREIEALSLRYAAGLRNKEIAGILKLSERHTAVLLGRCVDKLRDLMEKEESK